MQSGASEQTTKRPEANPARRRFALLTAAATFVLVWMGGLVTSHGAGLAVPDWPNSYGYNMFFFPASKWLGGIFYEHTHRLVASGVGLLTTILALWLFGRNARPLLRRGGGALLLAGLVFIAHPPVVNRMGENIMLAGIGLAALAAGLVWPDCAPSPKWLRVLGVIAFAAVVLQGVLGGLRVTLLKDQLGIFHATLAQLFFVLVCALALFQTEFWRNLGPPAEADGGRPRFLFTAATVLVFCQLVLGATMRHQHAGLAIPDFPAAYGKIWPATDAASVLKYNQLRLESQGYADITAFQIILQMAHRLMAAAIFVMVAACLWMARRHPGPRRMLPRLALGWFALVVVQIFLGAATIWTGKKADIATAHVACGALSLMTGSMVSILSFRLPGAPTAETAAARKNNLASWQASSSISR